MRNTFHSIFCTRDASARLEATRKPKAPRTPIFLFQSATVVPCDPKYWDCAQDFRDGNGCPGEGCSNPELDTHLIDQGVATRDWVTESVWLTRREAEAYGRDNERGYPEGWRVYAVCAEGELVDALRDGSEGRSQ